MNEKKHSTKKWIKFVDIIEENGYKVKFENVKGTNNMFADYLSREVYSLGRRWSNNTEK